MGHIAVIVNSHETRVAWREDSQSVLVPNSGYETWLKEVAAAIHRLVAIDAKNQNHQIGVVLNGSLHSDGSVHHPGIGQPVDRIGKFIHLDLEARTGFVATTTTAARALATSESLHTHQPFVAIAWGVGVDGVASNGDGSWSDLRLGHLPTRVFSAVRCYCEGGSCVDTILGAYSLQGAYSSLGDLGAAQWYQVLRAFAQHVLAPTIVLHPNKHIVLSGEVVSVLAQQDPEFLRHFTGKLRWNLPCVLDLPVIRQPTHPDPLVDGSTVHL